MWGMKRRLVPALGLVLAAGLVFGTSACGRSASSPPGGTLAAAPPSLVVPSNAAPLREGERFETVAMPGAYTPVPPHGGTDEYRCFLVDPKLTEPAFLTGSQFLPQNAEIVHHAIIYRVAPSEVAHAKARGRRRPGRRLDVLRRHRASARRFGATGRRLGRRPGRRAAKETLFDAKVGYPVEPGSQIVMQVHYNLLATDGRAGPQRPVRRPAAPAAARRRSTAADRRCVAAPIELPCTAAGVRPAVRPRARPSPISRPAPGRRPGDGGRAELRCATAAPPPARRPDPALRPAKVTQGRRWSTRSPATCTCSAAPSRSS